jgi:hypothetical protein
MKAALAEAGFDNVDATSVEQTLFLEAANGLTDTLLQAAVRTKALLVRQDPAARLAITDAIAQGVEKLFRCPGGFQFPMTAVVGSGAKR